MDEIVRGVTEGFNIKAKSYSKSKAAFFLDTDIGVLIMKKQTEIRKAEAAFKATELLHGAGFKNAERFLTVNGKPYVFVNEGIYTLSECGNGVRCNLADMSNALLIARAIAEMHNSPVKPFPGIDVSKSATSSYYTKRIAEARHIKKWLDNRSRYTDIDVLFVKKYSEFLTRAIETSKRICGFVRGSELYLSCSEIKEENILIDADNNVTILNFENCSLAPRGTDLCHYIRRFVKRGGDPSFAREIIAAYGGGNGLTQSELEYIKAYLSFPHKFFALINKYYNSKRTFDNSYALVKLRSETEYHDKIAGILKTI